MCWPCSSRKRPARGRGTTGISRDQSLLPETCPSSSHVCPLRELPEQRGASAPGRSMIQPPSTKRPLGLSLSCCTHPAIPWPRRGWGSHNPPGLNSSGLSHSFSSWCTDQRLMMTLAPLGMEYSPMLQSGHRVRQSLPPRSLCSRPGCAPGGSHLVSARDTCGMSRGDTGRMRSTSLMVASR